MNFNFDIRMSTSSVGSQNFWRVLVTKNNKGRHISARFWISLTAGLTLC
jgi:hypothetical protein